jgi:hypothetical protein
MTKRLVLAVAACLLVPCAQAEVTAIRAGRLVDPERGRLETNQLVLVDAGRIVAVGKDVAIPAGASLIDLADLTVLPGLVDTHTHLGLTYKDVPEHDYYYLTYVMESTRQNELFGAKVIKICVDCKPWGYSVDEMKLFAREAAKAGLKVAGATCRPPMGRRARSTPGSGRSSTASL